MQFNKTLIRSIILGVAVILIGIIGSKILQKLKEPPKPFISFQTTNVRTQEVILSDIQHSIKVQGVLTAMNRLELFSEVSGVLFSQKFRSGQNFKKGEVLLSIDQSEFLPQLKAQKSNFIALLNQSLVDLSIDYPEDYAIWNDFSQSISPEKALPLLPSSSKESIRFLTNRNVLATYYNIKSAENRATKYQIVAPFSGTLTETLIDPGALVRVGQKLGTLVQSGVFELETFISQSELSYLKIGDKVSLFSTQNKKMYVGKLSRIGQSLDVKTQLLPIYITISGNNLNEGMFVEAEINAGIIKDAFSLNRNLVKDNAVFAIQKDSTLKSIPVSLVTFNENNAIIKGIPSGTIILKNELSSAFEGLKVIPISE